MKINFLNTLVILISFIALSSCRGGGASSSSSSSSSIQKTYANLGSLSTGTDNFNYKQGDSDNHGYYYYNVLKVDFSSSLIHVTAQFDASHTAPTVTGGPVLQDDSCALDFVLDASHSSELLSLINSLNKCTVKLESGCQMSEGPPYYDIMLGGDPILEAKLGSTSVFIQGTGNQAYICGYTHYYVCGDRDSYEDYLSQAIQSQAAFSTCPSTALQIFTHRDMDPIP